MRAAYLPIAALAATLLLWLCYRLFRSTRDREAARAGYFDALKPLFETWEMRRLPTGFPRVSAQQGGLSFDLQALPDSLSFRKLPALWVMVSLPRPMPVGATLDILARPSGAEPFSRFADLPHSLDGPSLVPDGVAIRTDDAAAVPPETLVRRHTDLFADPKIKELVISPKGLRIVFLAEEADRSRYLIFRDAEMGMSPLAADRVAPLLDNLRALRDDLFAWSRELR